MVIDLKRRRCVDPSQCTTSSSEPPIVQRYGGRYGCEPRYVCPFNDDRDNDYNPCQYAVEVTEVFKGTVKVTMLPVQCNGTYI